MEAWRTVAAAALALAGMLGIAGDLARVGWLRGAAAATAAAPELRTFASRGPFEPHERLLTIDWTAGGRTVRSATVKPAEWARLRGPHDRRHAFAAALFDGPGIAARGASAGDGTSFAGRLLRVPGRADVDAALARALCGPAPALAEMGFPAPAPGERLRLRWSLRDVVTSEELDSVAAEVRCTP